MELVIARNEPVLLSLGSNQGDRRLHLALALRKLTEAGIQVQAISSLYETEPVDVSNQPDFLNLACLVETTLTPVDLLERCMEIEEQLGRVRSVRRGPRPVDIDIIYIGDRVIQSDHLTVPHPRRLQRRFVLEPIAEIAADFRDPVMHRSVSTLLSQCLDQARVQKSGKLEEKNWK